MIYLFNNNEEMIRIIPNSAIKRMYQTQKLTDENYISDRLDVEIQALNDEELSELEYMAIDDIENPQRFHYYFIVKETTEHQITSLTGVQSGIEELRKTPVYDMRPTNLSPKLIADRLLEGTNWQAGYTTNDVGTISTNFYYTDVFSALKKMCMAFGIEMQFFVEITTNRIGARYIEFRKRTGKSVGKRVVYGHNALKIVKEVEKTNTVTALIGRGRGVQVSESDEGHIGYGRKIGFENVEWKTTSGAPVDKPLGQEFVEIPELTLQYGVKNSNGTVRPKIGFVEFQDEESEMRLIDRTYNALLELSRPQVLLETSSVYLPDTGIGDTINVVRHDRDLRYQTRVFEITWDRLANQAVDMKLGDRLGESENKRISRISNQVSGNISTELGPTIDELVDRLTTADGKNTNWYTDYDPMENPETMGLVRVNDNWWQPDPEFEGEFILKQWNGEMWVEILRTSGNPELVRRFEEIEQQAQELANEIEANGRKAEEALRNAGLAQSAAESAITYADGVAKTAYDDAVKEAETIAQKALNSATGYTDSQIIEYDNGMELRIEQVVKGTNIDDLVGWASYKRTIDEATSTLTKIQGTAYKQAQTQLTIDSINQSITSGSDGRITNFNTLTNTVDSMEQLVGTPDKVARTVLTSDLWMSEIEKIGTSPNLFSENALINGLQTSPTQIDTIYRYDDGWYAVLEIDPQKTYSISGRAGLRSWGFTENRPDVLANLMNRTVHSIAGHAGITPPPSAKYLFMQFGHNDSRPFTSRIQVEEGSEITEYQPAVADNSSVRSAIQQQIDSISMGLFSAVGMFSGIDIVEKGVRITGDLIHLSGQSLIDDAVIKSANIDTLDAGKITTGELNASLIRVVNLDASSISGNEANFIRALFSGTTSTLQITGSGVNILDNSGRSSTYLDSSGIEFTRQGVALGKLEYVTNISDSGDLNNMNGFSMRPNRNSYFGVSYYQSVSATSSTRAFAVSGRTGNVYLSGLLKPSEQQPYGLNITWGTITGGSTNVEIWNHNKTGGIHIANGDLHYITSSGKWRSLNANLG